MKTLNSQMLLQLRLQAAGQDKKADERQSQLFINFL
jgi:hypothetical protein